MMGLKLFSCCDWSYLVAATEVIIDRGHKKSITALINMMADVATQWPG